MAKNLLFYIADILKDTDELNKYTRRDLEKKIKERGLEVVDRHTIRKCIDSLNDVGFDIVIEESKENKYYLGERIFEEWEKKLICDLVRQCDFLSKRDVNLIIQKLKKFTGKTNRKILEDTFEFNRKKDNECGNTKYIIDKLIKAMLDDRKVAFKYCEYNDKLEKLQKEKEYVVSPYKLLLKNGHYYLLLNKEGYRDVAFYRIDRIDDVRMLDSQRESLECILGKEYENKVEDIIKRRLYNYDGENIKLVIKVNRNALGEIIDNFYDGIIVLDSDINSLTIAVNSIKSEGLYYWLMQHLETVEVIRPEKVREELINRVTEVVMRYKK